EVAARQPRDVLRLPWIVRLAPGLDFADLHHDLAPIRCELEDLLLLAVRDPYVTQWIVRVDEDAIDLPETTVLPRPRRHDIPRAVERHDVVRRSHLERPVGPERRLDDRKHVASPLQVGEQVADHPEM